MDSLLQARILWTLAVFGCPRRRVPEPALVLDGSAAALAAFGLDAATIARIVKLRRDGSAAQEAARAHALGVRLLLPERPGYPAGLESHPDRPPLIYARGAAAGALPPPRRAAIVGARASSKAMERFATELGAACARHGIPVVSGLARGIDSAAHRGALLGDAPPIGVLGCGVDEVYPPGGEALHREVESKGALLSTFPLGSTPQPHHFPLRNRLLAALADVVVVVQARATSGSMSTARAALDRSAEVMAVPGSPDDPLSKGTNALIRDGARPVLEPADVVEAVLGVGSVARPESGGERVEVDGTEFALAGGDPAILRQIGSTALLPEEIASACGLDLGPTLERLCVLELAGRIERLAGGLFLRRNRP